MKRLFTLLLLIFNLSVSAQNLVSAREIIDTLTSATLWGRGYTRGGMQKAAAYITEEFKRAGLQPMAGENYNQDFSYPVNTFPGKMEVNINGKKLVPGKDFIIAPSSSGLKVKAELEQLDSITFISRENRLMILKQDKLTWGTAQQAEDFTVVLLDKKAMTELPEAVELQVENDLIPEFKTSNLCGMVKGTLHPDSVILFTAHYDHLGGMGENTYFPGANDNASGVALLLSLARYYAAHPQPYSIGFICFAGEEAGLLGSAYFTEHPLIQLAHIRFLLNVDIVGTGEKGITVVNSTLHPKEFAVLNRLNAKYKYLPAINPRGPAANSDHYNFTQKGVPAFFIYTQGGINAYHDIFDRAATLPLTKFKQLYHLFIGFNASLMR